MTTTKIHPLHSIDFLVSQMVHSGHYPDTARCTGRSTIQAMEYVTLALQNPHQWVHVRDHWETKMAHENMLRMCAETVEKLGFSHFKYDRPNLRMAFGTP